MCWFPLLGCGLASKWAHKCSPTAEDTACLVLGHRVTFGKVAGQLSAMLDMGVLNTNLPISPPRSLLCGGYLSTRWEGVVEAVWTSPGLLCRSIVGTGRAVVPPRRGGWSWCWWGRSEDPADS